MSLQTPLEDADQGFSCRMQGTQLYMSFYCATSILYIWAKINVTGEKHYNMTCPFLPVAKIIIAHINWALKKHRTKYFSCIISWNSHKPFAVLLPLPAFTHEETKVWICSKGHIAGKGEACHSYKVAPLQWPPTPVCLNSWCSRQSFPTSLSLFIKMILIPQGSAPSKTFFMKSESTSLSFALLYQLPSTIS